MRPADWTLKFASIVLGLEPGFDASLVEDVLLRTVELGDFNARLKLIKANAAVHSFLFTKEHIVVLNFLEALHHCRYRMFPPGMPLILILTSSAHSMQ